MPFLPPMAGNGKVTTHKNGDYLGMASYCLKRINSCCHSFLNRQEIMRNDVAEDSPIFGDGSIAVHQILGADSTTEQMKTRAFELQ